MLEDMVLYVKVTPWYELVDVPFPACGNPELGEDEDEIDVLAVGSTVVMVVVYEWLGLTEDLPGRGRVELELTVIVWGWDTDELELELVVDAELGLSGRGRVVLVSMVIVVELVRVETLVELTSVSEVFNDVDELVAKAVVLDELIEVEEGIVVDDEELLEVVMLDELVEVEEGIVVDDEELLEVVVAGPQPPARDGTASGPFPMATRFVPQFAA
jgi:hypothetical protein